MDPLADFLAHRASIRTKLIDLNHQFASVDLPAHRRDRMWDVILLAEAVLAGTIGTDGLRV